MKSNLKGIAQTLIRVLLGIFLLPVVSLALAIFSMAALYSDWSIEQFHPQA